ncbi:hypothetical protein [Streptomyces sp. NPDC088755]|uniref:hypothetical protein n=1 Tax=Streptomyces sp. NPDC088755 TaxID=3365888 RepID=UPI003815A293
MSETAQLAGGPLDGQVVELHPVQEQNGEYGALTGRDIAPWVRAPAYVRNGLGCWVWQGKPWPAS